MNALIDSLSDDLKQISGSSDASHIWNIAGYEYLMDKAARMIASAGKTLLLSVWKNDFPLLELALKVAEDEEGSHSCGSLRPAQIGP